MKSILLFIGVAFLYLIGAVATVRILVETGAMLANSDIYAATDYLKNFVRIGVYTAILWSCIFVIRRLGQEK